ncbi:MAG: hypothetical protein IKF17_03965 [Clostridia bacterium]|nr:hypothetical protein [Clostridia bacterium]
MKNNLRQNKGITLIALVITIIVLLILAGIAIASLTGENGLLERAVTAKNETGRASVIEQARTDILGYQADNRGGYLEKTQLKAVLDIYFKDVPTELPNGEELSNLELITLDKYGTHKIKVSEIYNGSVSGGTTLKIGDAITNYTSNTALPSGVNWIYFGTDGINQYLTTSQPISDACTINRTAEGWIKLEDTLNAACSLYIGDGATKARSITLADISRVTGFSKVESSAYTTYYFKSGENDSEHNQYNLCYPSKTSAEYWKSPTSSPESFVTPDYEYRDASDWHGPRVTCTILGVEHTNDEITDNINLESLKYVVGDSSEFHYAVATPTLWVYNNRAWFSLAFVGYGGIYSSDESLVSGDSDAVHDWTWNGGSASITRNVRPIIELPSSFELEKE